MKASPLSSEAQPLRRRERTALVLNIYDALAAQRGLNTVEQQATFHGVSRKHWSTIRNGHQSPSAALAMKVADQFEVEPRALWSREQVAV